MGNIGYGMMGGWGGSFWGVFGLAFILVWFVVGVLAAMWLWRHVKK